MKRLRPGWLLFVAALALQLTWYAALMAAYVGAPGKLEGADFLAFYSAGRVAAEHGLSRVYNLDLEAAAQAETAGVPPGLQQVLPPNHPPFLFPFLALLARLPYRAAYFGYALLLYALAASGLPALSCALRQLGWLPLQVWAAGAGLLLFEPFFMSVLKGQDTALLLLGGLLWLAGFLRGDDRLSGLGLSLTLIRPQITLALALPFLFRRRRVFGWFLLGVAVLGLYSFLQVGWNGALDYLHILTLSAGGEGYGMGEAAMFDAIGLLRRLAPGLDPETVRTAGWGLYAAALVGLCALWGFAKEIKPWHLALAVTLTLFAVPHLHYHDLALLAVPLAGAAAAGVRRERLTVTRAAALPAAVSVVLLFSELWDPARFTVPYLLMAFLPWLAWRYETH